MFICGSNILYFQKLWNRKLQGSTLQSYDRIVKGLFIPGQSLARKVRGWKDDPRQAERAGREFHGCLNSSADLGTGDALWMIFSLEVGGGVGELHALNRGVPLAEQRFKGGTPLVRVKLEKLLKEGEKKREIELFSDKP